MRPRVKRRVQKPARIASQSITRQDENFEQIKVSLFTDSRRTSKVWQFCSEVVQEKKFLLCVTANTYQVMEEKTIDGNYHNNRDQCVAFAQNNKTI